MPPPCVDWLDEPDDSAAISQLQTQDVRMIP
jgi:hypothetical protein